MPELSEAGLHFGEAFCVGAERQGLALSQLTPAEQACVQTVGMGFERRVAAAFGGTPEAIIIPQRLLGSGGQDLGTLTYADGDVTLCLRARASGAPSCQVVGHGADALAATQRMLDLLGVSVAEA